MFNHNIVKKNCLQYYQVNRYCQQCFNLGLEYYFKCFLPGIQCSKCCTISSTMSLMVQLASASGELSEASLARKEILNKSAHSFAWISSNCQIKLEILCGNDGSRFCMASCASGQRRFREDLEEIPACSLWLEMLV